MPRYAYEVETLRRQLAQQPTAGASKVDALRAQRNRLAREYGELKRYADAVRNLSNETAQENATVKQQLAQARQRVAAATAEDPALRVNAEIIALRQQLQTQGAQFESLFQEQQSRIRELREGRRDRRPIITRRDRNARLKALHPDSLRLPEAEREKLMTRGMQILNQLNLQVDDEL